MAVESITPFHATVAMDAAVPLATRLTPQARRLVEGPVLATLLRLAAPTVALMLLQGVVSAGPRCRPEPTAAE
jgi:hypothetical protein